MYSYFHVCRLHWPPESHQYSVLYLFIERKIIHRLNREPSLHYFNSIYFYSFSIRIEYVSAKYQLQKKDIEYESRIHEMFSVKRPSKHDSCHHHHSCIYSKEDYIFDCGFFLADVSDVLIEFRSKILSETYHNITARVNGDE